MAFDSCLVAEKPGGGDVDSVLSVIIKDGFHEMLDSELKGFQVEEEQTEDS